MVSNKLIFVSIDFRVKLLGFLNRGILIVFLCTKISNFWKVLSNFSEFSVEIFEGILCFDYKFTKFRRI